MFLLNANQTYCGKMFYIPYNGKTLRLTLGNHDTSKILYEIISAEIGIPENEFKLLKADGVAIANNSDQYIENLFNGINTVDLTISSPSATFTSPSSATSAMSPVNVAYLEEELHGFIDYAVVINMNLDQKIAARSTYAESSLSSAGAGSEESKAANSTNNHNILFFVKTLTGRTLTIPIAQSRPMSELYDKVRSELGLNEAVTLKIILGGKVFENDNTPISFYGLYKESVVTAAIGKAKEDMQEVKISYGKSHIKVAYTPGVTTNHDIYVKTAELLNNDEDVLHKITNIYSAGGTVWFSYLPDNDQEFKNEGDDYYSAETKKIVDHKHTSATISAGPMDSIGVGAGAASAAEPLDPEVVVAGSDESKETSAAIGQKKHTVEDMQEVKISYGESHIKVAYTPGVTTNHDIYVKTAELLNNDEYVLDYINRSTYIDLIYGVASILTDNDDIFITISAEKGPYLFSAYFKEIVDRDHTSTTVSAGPMDSIGVGAGSDESKDGDDSVIMTPEAAAAVPEVVAPIAEDAAILLGLQALGVTLDPKNYNDDIQRTHRDFNNLVFVEYLLNNLFKIKYEKLITLDFDVKKHILRTLLTYYRTNETVAIRVLLTTHKLI